jgi:hypothetical protein
MADPMVSRRKRIKQAIHDANPPHVALLTYLQGKVVDVVNSKAHIEDTSTLKFNRTNPTDFEVILLSPL